MGITLFDVNVNATNKDVTRRQCHKCAENIITVRLRHKSNKKRKKLQTHKRKMVFLLLREKKKKENKIE